MRRLPRNHPTRIPAWVSVLVLCSVVGTAVVYIIRYQELYVRHAMNASSRGVLEGMAQAMSKLEESQVPMATTETLAGHPTDGVHLRTYGFELHGTAPHWEGTRFMAYRDGTVSATLTVQSAVEARWVVETEPLPEWWQVWK